MNELDYLLIATNFGMLLTIPVMEIDTLAAVQQRLKKLDYGEPTNKLTWHHRTARWYNGLDEPLYEDGVEEFYAVLEEHAALRLSWDQLQRLALKTWYNDTPRVCVAWDWVRWHGDLFEDHVPWRTATYSMAELQTLPPLTDELLEGMGR